MLDELVDLFRPVAPRVVESLLALALEIAREGREGHKVGTIFMIGDAETVLRHSRALILDPLACHPVTDRHVNDENLRGTVKALAELDGAFVVSQEGVFLAGCRYLDAEAVAIHLPFGLGARHMAAAAMSKMTSSVGIVVSETATVRVFRKGRLMAEISFSPEPHVQILATISGIEAAGLKHTA